MLATDHAIDYSIDDVDTSCSMTKRISAPARTKLALSDEREELDRLGDTQLDNNAIDTNCECA